jgi:hypothetical protein
MCDVEYNAALRVYKNIGVNEIIALGATRILCIKILRERNGEVCDVIGNGLGG